MKRYLLLGVAAAALVLGVLTSIPAQAASQAPRLDMGHGQAGFDGGWHN